MSEDFDKIAALIGVLQSDFKTEISGLRMEVGRVRSEVSENDNRSQTALRKLQTHSETQFKMVRDQIQHIDSKIDNLENRVQDMQNKFSELKERVSTVEIMATSALRSGAPSPYIRPSLSLDMAASAGTRDLINKRRNYR